MLDGFYVDILLTDSEKAEILRKNRGILSPVKNCGDYYSFEKTLLIHNISEANVKAESPQATTGFWYVEVCFVNFFDACESLYRLLLCVHAAKPDLHYRILKTDFIFQEEPIEQFIGQVYLCVRHYKRYYNHVRGTLSVMVGRDYETFRRRNFKRFEKEQGDISILLRNIEYLTECAAELAQSAEAQHERLKPLGDTGTYTLSYDWNFPAEKEQLELLKEDGHTEEKPVSYTALFAICKFGLA